MNHGRGAGGRAEAERMLGVARKLLDVRDLVGSKRFAERAVESDPLVDGADQILAISDVLLASQRRINNDFDWYAILQLTPPYTGPGADDGGVAVKREFRRLALLLNPGQNSAPGADAAFRLVADAYSVLSNPQKRSNFDAEYRIATASAAPGVGSGAAVAAEGVSDRFWTACPNCCNVHQYMRQYLNISLRCPVCSRPFRAAEVSSAPPIVPGTDMYYCSWGFFPLGFPGGPNFNEEYKPFQPMFPGEEKRSEDRSDEQSDKGKDSGDVPRAGAGTRTKKMARKSVMDPGSVRRSLRNRSNGKGPEEDGTKTNVAHGVTTGGNRTVEGRGGRLINLEEDVGGSFNINRELRGNDGGGGSRTEDMSFHIDVDATDEILGNLQNLPFLKDVGVPLRFT